MPLLHRRPFVPNSRPKNLGPDDEVFYCPLTKEIFTDYEEFFERTILCNSLVWSCSITDRGNMTYQEALDHETAARKKFEKFPKDLRVRKSETEVRGGQPAVKKPILLLVRLMSRSRIEELNDSIFSFIKKRYFIGEQLEVRVKASKYETCRVLDVLPTKPIPRSAMNGHTNGSASSDDDEDDDKPLSKFVKAKHFEPDEVKYQVKISCASLNPIRTVPVTALRRKMRREQCKIFLKRMCVQDMDSNRVYVVREDIVKKFGLDSTKWEDVFAGPIPLFSSQSPKTKKTVEKTEAKTAEKKALASAKQDLLKAKKEKAKEELIMQEMKRHEREMKLEMKKKEAEELRRQKQILMEQRREKIERMREVKRRLAEYKKVWNKQRDDLECDDLKDMPQPKEIVTRVPPHLFGSVLCLLEFFHTFEALFDAKDEFPRGVSLGLLEKAIMDENQDGPMCDVLFFFLSNLFRTRTEEEGEKLFVVEREDKELSQKARHAPSVDNIVASATLAATWPQKYQGCSLNNLELDSYTVSEILRIYLLTSPARPPSDSRLWRFQQRGGYCTADDTALRMCLDRPELIQKLSTTSIFNFTPDEKVDILSCLSNHLLSFVTPRDFMDDMSEKYWSALLLYREDKRCEKKREKDFEIERMKLKNSLMVIHPEKKENADENTGETGPDGEEVKKEGAHLMTAEERLEHLRTMVEEERVVKEAWQFRQKKHLDDISRFKKFKVLPLGEDRFFRRYWALNCIPGLLVEQYEDNGITEDLLTIKVPQQGQFSWDVRTFLPTRVPNNSSATPTETNLPTGTNVLQNIAPVNGGANSPPLAQNYDASSPQEKCGALQMNGGSPALVVTKNGSTSIDGSQKGGFDAGTQGKSYKWFIYSEEEEIEEFICSLNKRGFREAKLHDSLHHVKQRIFSKLRKCPINDLCQIPKVEDMKAKSVTSKIAIELSLRDQILDLESRIFEGTLGGITEEDGICWVERMTQGGTYDDELRNKLMNSVLFNSGGSNKMEGDDNEEEEEEHQQSVKEDKMVAPPAIGFPIVVDQEEIQNRESGDGEHDMELDTEAPPKTSEKRKMQDLALALLQIERGIDRKYLKSPLGYSVDIKRRKTRSKGPIDDSEEEIARRKKESAPYLRRWELSLINCTSLSQVSLHLTTLNKCIIWARSVLNASCRICHRRSDADKMLLCDSCDRGHHMYCLKPALKSVPIGDWFCPQCKPIHSNRISTRKVRTTSFTQEASSEEDEDTEADETEEEEDQEEEEPQEEDAEGDSDEEDESSQEEDDDDEEEEEEPNPPKKGLRYKFPKRPIRTSGKERKTKNTSSMGNSMTRTRCKPAGRGTDSSKFTDSLRKSRSASDGRLALKRNASNEEEYDNQGSSSSRRRSTGVWKELNTCQEVLKDLIQHKDSWLFLVPVSKKQVPDYYDIIKHPMDFSTMQNKLKSVEYADPSEFITDAKLVFSNCLTYNMPRSVPAKAAMQLNGYFEKRMRDTGLDKYKDAPPTKKRKS